MPPPGRIGSCSCFPYSSPSRDASPPETDATAFLAALQAAAPVVPAEVRTAYGKLPLHFEPNQGQTGPQVQFLARGPGYILFLTRTEAVLVLRGGQGEGEASGPQRGWQKARVAAPSARPSADAGRPTASAGVLRMQMVGANPAAQVVGLEELPGKSNYFIGNDPRQWRTHIPLYAWVKVANFYPAST